VRGHDWQRHGPGFYKDGTPMAQTKVHAQQIGWFMMEAVNHGIVATIQWEAYDMFYDKPLHCGALGGPEEGWPVRPSYHLLRLFTHTTRPGWNALQITGQRADCTVSCMRGADGHQTIFAQNRSKIAQEIRIDGAPADASFHRVIWNRDGDTQLSDGGAIRCDHGGDIRIQLAPESVAALTDSDGWKSLIQK